VNEQLQELRRELMIREGEEFERFSEGTPEAELCRLAAERLTLPTATKKSTRVEIPEDLKGDYRRPLSTQRTD
jgi:hypothetical protein